MDNDELRDKVYAVQIENQKDLQWRIHALQALGSQGTLIKRELLQLKNADAFTMIEHLIQQQQGKLHAAHFSLPKSDKPRARSLNLDKQAPRLRKRKGTKGFYYLELRSRDAMSRSYAVAYVDPDEVALMGIKSWLELSQSKFGGHQSDLVPLYINGMTKTGKSLTANEFLLSVVRDDPVFGVGRPKEVSVFRLCMDYLSRNYGIRLEELLLRIIQWVEAESLPLSPASVLDDAKAAVYNRYGKEHIQEEITLLLAAIQVPTLMIIDESHLWFRPTDLEDNVDKPARREAGLFFKDLLTSQGNGRTLWVFTANKMATFWAGLASVPTNGTPLTLHKWQIDLPISTPNTLMQLFWDDYNGRNRDLQPPEAFLELSRKYSVALLSYVLYAWNPGRRPEDASEFFEDMVSSQMIVEGLHDFYNVLAEMNQEQRAAMLALSSINEGADLGMFKVMGLDLMLKPYVTLVSIVPERYVLTSGWHREMIQRILDPDGSINPKWKYRGSTSAFALMEASSMLQRIFPSNGSNGSSLNALAFGQNSRSCTAMRPRLLSPPPVMSPLIPRKPPPGIRSSKLRKVGLAATRSANSCIGRRL